MSVKIPEAALREEWHKYCDYLGFLILEDAILIKSRRLSMAAQKLP